MGSGRCIAYFLFAESLFRDFFRGSSSFVCVKVRVKISCRSYLAEILPAKSFVRVFGREGGNVSCFVEYAHTPPSIKCSYPAII